MALRKIIQIDEEKCDGCGECVTGCAEGALVIVNGKAKLIGEAICDGFGDCVGECPQGALTVTEREAEEYNEEITRMHLMKTRGQQGVQAFENAQAKHQPVENKKPAPPFHPPHPGGGGCPGAQAKMLNRQGDTGPNPVQGSGDLPQVVRPAIDQWPIQLHLVPPAAPFFKNRDLVLMSTCAPLACPDVNWRYVHGRGIAVACPKLDRLDGYVEKLAAILSEPTIPRVLVLRMQVPCCGGLTQLALEARNQNGRTDLIVEEVVVGLEGEVQFQREL